MAVNWFEGGRRISHLFMGMVALGGAAYVAMQDEPTPTLSIWGPTMPWFVGDQDCKSPSYERLLWDFDWGGKKPGLVLCFLALSNGKIPYAVAPTPPEEMKRRAAEAIADKARVARGEPPTIRLESPWFYGADEDDERVQAYVSNSVADLRITPELRQRLLDSRSAARWRAYRDAFRDALPWVGGLCALIWVATAIVGWIVRGFAGIPMGEDFRHQRSGE